MKRSVCCLFFLCLGLLSACGGDIAVTGRVAEVAVDAETGAVSFVVRADGADDVGILLTDDTSVLSPVDGFPAEAFKQRPQPGADVSVVYRRGPRAAGGNPASEVQVTKFLTQETAALPDGTTVSVWKAPGQSIYQLEDGTELLRVQETTGPDRVYVEGLESLDDLSGAARENVLAYYREQGPLYRVQDELEKAYAGYQESADSAAFVPYAVSQAIIPTASNERVLYFQTIAALPIDAGQTHELRVGAAFDRETGRAVNNWELFSCPEEEARQKILDLAVPEDPVLRAETEAALRPEYIVVLPDHLEISFPQGALPGQAHDYTLGLDYDGALSEILAGSMIPKGGE